jgi:histone RNA hairpin-binding protein
LHEQELDPHKIAQRQKQIDFGKNTIGYSNYIRLVPLLVAFSQTCLFSIYAYAIENNRQQRTKSDPQTPDVRAKYSKRQWDGIMKKWRRQLHQWDPVTDQRPGAQLVRSTACTVALDLLGIIGE